MSNRQKRILITGGTGFIGAYLVPELIKQQHNITLISRNPDKAKQQFKPHTIHAIKHYDELDNNNPNHHFDIIINLAGQGLAEKRWTPTIKQQLRDSRINTTQALINYLEQTPHKPELLISGSAIGYYGLRGDEKITEQDQGDNSYSSQLCQDWEAIAQTAHTLNIRTCLLRTGIVLGQNGGALSKMLLPFKLGLGGPMGGGKQYMSWIHISDMLSIIQYLIDNQALEGAINATAPNPVTNKEFAKTLGKALNRPAFIPMPAFVLKIMMGEMAEELLLSGQRVMPNKLEKAGYSFKYEQLADALSNITHAKQDNT